MLDDYVHQTIRIRAKVSGFFFQDAEFGTKEMVQLSDIYHVNDDVFLLNGRAVPLSGELKAAGLTENDTIEFSAYIPPSKKAGAKPALTKISAVTVL